MRGLPLTSPSTTLCTLSTPSILFNKLTSLFKRSHSSNKYTRQHNSFNPDHDSSSRSNARYPPEKPYHHVPTHAAKSHLKTTTTIRMREIEEDVREQHELDERLGRDSRVGEIVTDGSWGDVRRPWVCASGELEWIFTSNQSLLVGVDVVEAYRLRVEMRRLMTAHVDSGKSLSNARWLSFIPETLVLSLYIPDDNWRQYRKRRVDGVRHTRTWSWHRNEGTVGRTTYIA